MQVGYCLGGDLVSISSSSFVMKAVPVGSLLGGMMNGPRGAVRTLVGSADLVHGNTLVGAYGRGSLGYIVGCVDVMASRKFLLVVTGPPIFCRAIFQISPWLGVL